MDLWAGGSIGENIRFVFVRIRHATQQSGRPEGSIRLVAATKSVGLDQIREGVTAGLTILGENHLTRGASQNRRAAEATDPVAFYRALAAAKGSPVVGGFDLIHSVDCLEMAEGIDRRAQEAGLPKAVLLEVNLEGKATKAGFLSDELDGAMPSVGALPHVTAKRLMAIPRHTSDPEQASPSFVVCVSWRCACHANLSVPYL